MAIAWNELWSSTWQVSSASTWEPVDLQTYGVAASSVAYISITNLATNEGYTVGVRAKDSSKARTVEIHEAEGGGEVVVNMFVQVDSGYDIECFSDSTSNVYFRLTGYFTGCTYYESVPYGFYSSASGWNDADLSGADVAPADNSVCTIWMYNNSTSAVTQMGVRENGSSLSRRITEHESEGGGLAGCHLCVKCDGDKTIEEYDDTSGGNSRYYYLGYFSSAMDYVEVDAECVNSGSAGSWNDSDLSGTVPANTPCEINCYNSTYNTERYAGARKDGTSLERRVDLHEAEPGGGGTDFTVITETNGSAVVDIYEENLAACGCHVKGYFTDGVAQYTKTFSADAILMKRATKTFDADGILLKRGSKTFDADAWLALHGTKTFDADALLLQRNTKTFDADAILLKRGTKTFDVDALLTRRGTKTFDADALLLKRQTKTFSADGVLLKRQTKTFSADAILKQIGTSGFSADAWLQTYGTQGFDADAVLVKRGTVTFSADAWLLAYGTSGFSADAILTAPALLAVGGASRDAVARRRYGVRRPPPAVDSDLVRLLIEWLQIKTKRFEEKLEHV